MFETLKNAWKIKELRNKIDDVLGTMDASDFNELMAYAISIQPLSED